MTDIKQKILEHLIADLTSERDIIARAAETAQIEATHPEAKPENQYDTRSLEASYLAGAQLARMAELTAKIEWLRNMELRSFTRDDQIAPSALVQLDSQGKIRNYFLTAWVSGYTYKIEEKEIHVISVQSPFGAAINSKKTGDFVTVLIGSQDREFEILNIK
jgi:transcription elongation GreA/GreB family factor